AARDAGEHRAMVRSEPGLDRQGIRDAGPARPLVVELAGRMVHDPGLGQEDIGDGPIKTAGAPHAVDVPAVRHDLDLGAFEHAAPVLRLAAGIGARRTVVDDLEAAEHPAAFHAAAAEAPAAADP